MKNVIRHLIVSTLLLALGTSLWAKDLVLTGLIGMNPGESAYEGFLEKVRRFEEQNPGIKLEIDAIGHDAYHTKLQTLVVSGQLPDVLYLWPGKRTSYVTSKDLAMDLRPFIEKDGVQQEFLPIITASQGDGGQVYQLGQDLNLTNVVYANERLLKEIGLSYPKTMGEWQAQAKKIRDAGYFPLVMGNKSNWVMQSCMLSPLMGRVGGNEWFDSARTGQGGSFTDPEFVNAFKLIEQMVQSELIDKSVNSLERGKAIELFFAERAVYFIEGGWSTSNFVEALDDEQKQYVSLNLMPSISGEKTPNSTAGVAGTGFGINAKLKGTPKAEAAWKWVKAFAGYGTADIALKYGGLPALTSLELPETTDPMIRKLAEVIQGANVTYVLDDRMDPEGANWMNTALQELIYGSKTAQGIAQEYEDWVAKNDSNRK